jgi:trans-aconitate methyltransferase
MGDTSADAREWDATTYHRVSNPQFGWGQRVLDRVPLRGDETVVDAGCGSGRLTAELLGRLPNGRVIAVDRSENMLRMAREHLAPRFGDRVTFLCRDLAALDLDQVADVVFSTATFHWVLDHPGLFREIYRALKPGGLLVAQCGGGPNLERLHDRAAELAASSPFAPFFADWTGPWEFADDVTTSDRLRAAGLVEIETELEAAPTTLADAGEFAEFLTGVILRAHLERLPSDNLRTQFVASLTNQAAADDPPFFLDYWRLNMRGRRPR